jgi:hypothetical protein
MTRLDSEAAAAVVRPSRTPTAAEVLAYLEELPRLYDAAEPATQKHILQALFERVEVLGRDQIWLMPGQPRKTWASGRCSLASSAPKCVRLVGARGFEPAGTTAQVVLPEWIAKALSGAA